MPVRLANIDQTQYSLTDEHWEDLLRAAVTQYQPQLTEVSPSHIQDCEFGLKKLEASPYRTV